MALIYLRELTNGWGGSRAALRRKEWRRLAACSYCCYTSRCDVETKKERDTWGHSPNGAHLRRLTPPFNPGEPHSLCRPEAPRLHHANTQRWAVCQVFLTEFFICVRDLGCASREFISTGVVRFAPIRQETQFWGAGMCFPDSFWTSLPMNLQPVICWLNQIKHRKINWKINGLVPADVVGLAGGLQLQTVGFLFFFVGADWDDGLTSAFGTRCLVTEWARAEEHAVAVFGRNLWGTRVPSQY